MTTESIMALADAYANNMASSALGEGHNVLHRQALLTAVDGLVALTEQCKINVALYKQIADDKSAAIEALVRDAARYRFLRESDNHGTCIWDMDDEGFSNWFHISEAQIDHASAAIAAGGAK